MKLTPAKISKKAAAATAHIDAITNDMLDTSASELLRRQPVAEGVETISFLERWSTSGTQEIVLHQKEIDGERSVWRFVGPSKDLPNMMKHVRAGGVPVAGSKRARRAEDEQGAEDEEDEDEDEVEVEMPRNARRRAAAAAARPTAGTTRARKAAAAAAAAGVVFDQDPFVTPSTNAQRSSKSASGREDSGVRRAPKKARRVPTASSALAEASDDDGDATETEATTPRGSKRSTAKSTANNSPSDYNTNVTLRRSLRRRREVSEVSDSTVAASLDDLGSLCGGIDDLGFDVTDQDTEMGRGSVVPRPTASTSRVKVEHDL
ncbi:BZ3500_MvSof-1268-A1-R1_Chr1-2g01438 [Microbotryum saponariae]|uniref:BZ3500_MvSof-1268-A1-R1_Chr1-2g01438 protein n=1 Tax=Microbotryum saponariae TaxID=289078 RepID=A0A2X0KWC4_9BASI|nr:BZ3500_MvSof-1268-A1-R1_Chr1-2g01438 [Microbotryum saponariae]SCZ97437.1 BZ3501_MvSof-1269-A2-R1_Chr1-2g01037 [Microbotryum saponariae]